MGPDGVAHRDGDVDGVRRVGMDADGIGADLDVLAADRLRQAFQHGPQAAPRRLIRILGVVLAGDDERPSSA